MMNRIKLKVGQWYWVRESIHDGAEWLAVRYEDGYFGHPHHGSDVAIQCPVEIVGPIPEPPKD